MDFRTGATAVGLLVLFCYVVGSGIWVNNSPGWYASLNRPPWQPPDFVFGLIWPYNFIILGVAAFKIPTSLPRNETIVWLCSFAFSVIAALSWAYNFYGPHHLQLAAISLGITALLTLPILFFGFRASLALGIALIPYQLWVAIATTLAWGYATRN